MIKVTGKFKEYKSKVILIINLEDTLFEKLKDHIVNNMFFSYRRVAPKFKKILLTSIGDHIDKNNRQDLSNAEIGVEVAIETEAENNLLYLLDKADCWYLCLRSHEKTFVFSINKENQLIDARSYTVVE